MQIRDYVAVITKRWWVVVAALVAAVVTAYGVSKLIPQTFRAQAVYLVIANRVDNGLSLTMRNTMNSYRELVLQPDALEQISQQLQLDVSGERLLADVTVQSLPDESKILIEADHRSLVIAQQIAGAVGQRIEEEVNRINATLEGTDRIFVRQIQRPRFLSLRPNTRINVLAGAFLGLVVGLLLTFILEYLDDTLKNPGDVERFVGLPTLGAIPAGEPPRGK